MKEFRLSTGTNILIDDKNIVIEREGGKSVMKGLFMGRTMGLMCIKRSSVTGIIFFADYLIICALGIPSPTNFALNATNDVKCFPNCVVAKVDELKEVYDYLINL